MLTVILFSHVVIFQAPIMNPDSAGTHFILRICMNAMIYFFLTLKMFCSVHL